MKIHFSGCDTTSRTGPNTFANRLSKQFKEMGHDIVGPYDDYDVWLCFIQPSSYPKPGSKKVARFDGFWCSPLNYHQNGPLKQLYNLVDDVVIQTEFDRKYMTKFFGERKNIHVIGNGIDLNTTVLEIEKKEDEMRFVCAADWHGQKRLKENIRLFQQIREKSDKECILSVFGNTNRELSSITKKEMENVVLKSNRMHLECLSEYKVSDWFLHLAYLDHCPNVVIEAISQGCPVIHTNSGGTKEVVKNNGVMIEEPDFNFELTDYDNPPILDLTGFELPKERPFIDASHLDIKTVAEQYMKVFES